MAAGNIQFTKIEIRIAIYLFKHYKESSNARQLARVLTINHAHANILCNRLVSKRLLTKEERGNAAYFSFAYTDALAIKFMEYLLSLEEKDFPKWLIVVLHSLQKLRPYLQMGAVFGSSVKSGDFNDVDVLLIYDKKESRNIRTIKEEIMNSQLIEKPLRYVDLSEKDLLSNREDTIFYRIMSENLIFHNPAKYVEVLRNLRKIWHHQKKLLR